MSRQDTDSSLQIPEVEIVDTDIVDTDTSGQLDQLIAEEQEEFVTMDDSLQMHASDDTISHAVEEYDLPHAQPRKKPAAPLAFWKILSLLLAAMVMLLGGLLYLQWQSLRVLEKQMYENRSLLNDSNKDQMSDINSKLQQYFENYAGQMKSAEMQLEEYQNNFNAEQEKLRQGMEEALKKGLATIRLEQISESPDAKVEELRSQVSSLRRSLNLLRNEVEDMQRGRVVIDNTPSAKPIQTQPVNSQPAPSQNTSDKRRPDAVNNDN